MTAHIVIVTGMSGSGKSTAIRALEDAGFFCIDNLPVLLLPKVTELLALGEHRQPLALVIDAREGHFLSDAPRIISEAKRAGHRVETLFLDSSDEALVRRFSETRRRHPLAPGGSVAQGIKLDRHALHDLREVADQVIDTSELTVHDLKRLIHARYASESGASAPALSILSFGYRYGVPPQADLVFDARFLPNPYFIPELKGFTGHDPKVAEFVLGRPETQEFLSKVVDLCEFLFPRYQSEGKAYLTVAVGCTGGKHRSVALAREIFQRLSSTYGRAQLWDRDIDKE